MEHYETPTGSPLAGTGALNTVWYINFSIIILLSYSPCSATRCDK